MWVGGNHDANGIDDVWYGRERKKRKRSIARSRGRDNENAREKKSSGPKTRANKKITLYTQICFA